jgi:hypothetical protein
MIAERKIVEVNTIKNSSKTIKIEIPESLSVLENPKEIAPKGFGTLRIITPKDGDYRVVWNNNSFEQIKDAKETFDKLVSEGLIPYKVDVGGKKTSEIMTEFDAYAEEIIFCPIGIVTGG